MPAMSVNQLRDRVSLDRFVSGAWSLDSVVSARVEPGPPARLIPVSEAGELPIEANERLDVTVRYRSDIGPLGKTFRVRRGADTLVVIQVIGDVTGTREWSRLTCERFLTYLSRHDALLARVASLGAAVSFSAPTTSANTPNTYDAPTDTPASPPATVTCSGRMMEVSAADARRYVPQTNIESATLQGLFAPDTYGDLPVIGATCTWGGQGYAIASVNPIAPDSVPIGAVVGLER